jgi:hypothetical protein
MVLKTLLLVIVIAILMEDSTSIKKTPEEEKEEREMAEKVNATLAEEEKERQEEEEKEKKRQDRDEKQEDEKEKKKKDRTQDEKKKMDSGPGIVEKEDEASSSNNGSVCPVFKECGPCPEAPSCPPCEECPEVERCPPCKECGSCPPVKPCPGVNSTVDQPPSISGCPAAGEATMTVPVAMAVGAAAGLLITGAATIIGLIIRYLSPIESGFLFLTTIIVVWYLCSHHPETARELGGRAWTALQEAAVALGHRVMEAIRHQEQVGLLISPNLFLRMSSMFPKVCTKIFYVVENLNF